MGRGGQSAQAGEVERALVRSFELLGRMRTHRRPFAASRVEGSLSHWLIRRQRRVHRWEPGPELAPSAWLAAGSMWRCLKSIAGLRPPMVEWAFWVARLRHARWRRLHPRQKLRQRPGWSAIERQARIALRKPFCAGFECSCFGFHLSCGRRNQKMAAAWPCTLYTATSNWGLQACET